MIELNADISSLLSRINQNSTGIAKSGNAPVEKADFTKAIDAAGKYISRADELQQASEVSMKDLLAGKNEDITSVVSSVAKADMSFKVLVGVRNKLIEAYKQTINMQI